MFQLPECNSTIFAKQMATIFRVTCLLAKKKPISLVDLWEPDFLKSEIKRNVELRNLYKDVQGMYEKAFEGGVSLEPDSFGGYKLMNRSKNSFSIHQEIEVAAGLLCMLPRDKSRENHSLMQNKQGKDQALLGVAQWQTIAVCPIVTIT